jgi:hypothetical protein
MLISGWFPSSAQLKKKQCQTTLPELDYERGTLEGGGVKVGVAKDEQGRLKANPGLVCANEVVLGGPNGHRYAASLICEG